MEDNILYRLLNVNKNWRRHKCIFTLSTARTGTVTLAWLKKHNPEILKRILCGQSS